MEGQRSAIIELFQNGKRQCEIIELLNVPKERRKFVYNTIHCYNETGSVRVFCSINNHLWTMDFANSFPVIFAWKPYEYRVLHPNAPSHWKVFKIMYSAFEIS